MDHAAENDYGVPAYNVNNLEQTQAVLEAANETGSPVILQASAGAKICRSSFLKAFDYWCTRAISAYSNSYAPRPWCLT